jgi:hypothetical protein
LRFFQVEGLTLDCHAVHGNFLRENPTNVAVVFHCAKDTMALSHNVPATNIDPTGLGLRLVRSGIRMISG